MKYSAHCLSAFLMSFLNGKYLYNRMKGLPDVAASLFTNDYRDVKLKGKKARLKGPGTGSVSFR